MNQQRAESYSYRTVVLWLAYAWIFSKSCTHAFVPTAPYDAISSPGIHFSSIPKRNHMQRKDSFVLHSSSTQNADFEYQELKIQLQAMKDQDVVTNQLQESFRGQLEGYIRRILRRRESKIPLYDMAACLPSSKWRLAYSTQPLTASNLPNDVRIELTFYPDNKTLDYTLKFTKTFGLSQITAHSTYQVDSSPVNPGLLTYTYERLSTNAFGMKNLGLGTMGLLEGRTSQIPTAYFDNQVWIEVGYENGQEYFNVYTREDDDF